ncbi:MAG: hypothetical protein V1659_00225 [Candidatus Woesearchaeota archaeon]
MTYNQYTENKKGYTLVEVGISFVGFAILLGALALAERTYHAMGAYINRSKTEVRIRNVTGDSIPEVFIDRNGRRFFAEIDGISISSVLSTPDDRAELEE